MLAEVRAVLVRARVSRMDVSATLVVIRAARDALTWISMRCHREHDTFVSVASNRSIVLTSFVSRIYIVKSISI